jgi:uncharacterized protein (TIGR02246 family)
MRSPLIAAIAFVAAFIGCTKKDAGTADTSNAMAAAAPAVDKSAAEATIRQADEAFNAAMKAKDANAAVALYSDDAVSNPPNSPPLVGIPAIRKYNEDFLKTPQIALTGEATSIKFSDDGSVAYETGKYSASWVDAKGRTIKDEGKFLNVWKNVDGKWKIVVDAFSSNLPPPK